jgi:hypothetical protein
MESVGGRRGASRAGRIPGFLPLTAVKRAWKSRSAGAGAHRRRRLLHRRRRRRLLHRRLLHRRAQRGVAEARARAVERRRAAAQSGEEGWRRARGLARVRGRARGGEGSRPNHFTPKWARGGFGEKKRGSGCHRRWVRRGAAALSS